MMTAKQHPLVADYLERLRRESLRLPHDQASELVSDIAGHLDDSLREGATETDVRNVLDRIGSPAELVDAAGGRRPEQDAQPRRGPWESGAIIGFLVAEAILVLFPLAVVAWVVGLVCLALSRAWGLGEKVLAVAGLALGMPVIGGSVLLAARSGYECTGVTVTGGPTSGDLVSSSDCTGGGLSALSVTAWVVLAAFLAFQVWTIWRLTRGHDRRPAAA